MLIPFDLCIDTGVYEPDRLAAVDVMADCVSDVVRVSNVLMSYDTFDPVLSVLTELVNGIAAPDRTKSVDDGLGDSTACVHEVVGG